MRATKTTNRNSRKNNRGSSAIGFLFYALIIVIASITVASISFPTGIDRTNVSSASQYLNSAELGIN